MSIERATVAVFGPIITAATAWLVGAVGKYGLHLNPTEVDVLATSGAVGAATFVVKWLHGRQNPEILKLEQEAKTVAGQLSPGLRGELEAFIRQEVQRGQQEVVKVITSHTQVAAAAQPAAPTQAPAQAAQPTA